MYELHVCLYTTYLERRRVGKGRAVVVVDHWVLLGLLKVGQEPNVLRMLKIKVHLRVKLRLFHVLVGVDLRWVEGIMICY